MTELVVSQYLGSMAETWDVTETITIGYTYTSYIV